MVNLNEDSKDERHRVKWICLVLIALFSSAGVSESVKAYQTGKAAQLTITLQAKCDQKF